MQYKIDTPEIRFALELARQAGELIREMFNADFTADWKQNETPVTQTDLELNKRFIEAVQKQFPGYSVLGEEQSHPVDGAEWTWVIDPIDGTGPFVQGIPLATCCVSLLDKDGTPVLGIIYDAMLDRMFYAQKGHGAYMNEQPIHVSDQTSLNRAYVHGDSMKSESSDKRFMKLREMLIAKGCTVMFMNAIQYGAAMVCAGRATGVVYTLPHAWDAAAVYAIGTEAGGVMTDLDGNQQRYDRPTNGFILGNPAIHAELLAMSKTLRSQAI